VWSAEKRAEGLEYMHPNASSHSGRIVGYTEVMLKTAFEEVIEANRRGTWTINALIGHVIF
jgi:hypothetical protein